ncbi:MAG: response regulator transcription factor [Spirochaetes bacterium]|nr:response regulator transcription factor [Spirochaetota bacterium]
MKVLIVEDEEKFLNILKLYFEKESFQVLESNNLKKALEIISNKSNNIDIIILDRLLPDGEGDDLLRYLRKNSMNIPVLMLTARGTEQDRIEGLLLGSDDYVVKPVSPYEIVLRVKNILKRVGKDLLDENVIIYKDLKIDKKRFLVFIENEKIELTKVEFEILYKLIKNKGIVFTRDQIINSIFNDGSYISERTVDAHIKNIRKKIKRDYIKTVFGLGYKVEE